MSIAPIEIGGRPVGPGYPCYVIAEIGINHNGERALAEQTIAAAAVAGADAVKFQSYRAEDFLSDRSITYSYRSQGKNVVESQYDMFKRCEIADDDLVFLRDACDRHGISFLSTPTSEEGVAALMALDAPALKNGSDYLGHLDLIMAMARTGRPTILSTGMATEEEVAEAVGAYRGAGGRDLVLLHCVSTYPTPVDQLNLRRMQSLAATFDCVVGFSDHSRGEMAALTAVALGAAVVEKHVTLRHDLPGPDHAFSAVPRELKTLIEGVRAVEEALGSAAITPADGEAEARANHRLSCVAASGLVAGHKLTRADVAFRRPGTGYRPALVATLIGRVLKCAAERGHVFHESDFVR